MLDASGELRFSNAAVDAGVANPPTGGYAVKWFHFDNATGTETPAGTTEAGEPNVSAPSGLLASAGNYVKAEIRAIDGADSSWAMPVHAYFVRDGKDWRLVGLERLPDSVKEGRTK